MIKPFKKSSKSWHNYLWDTWCLLSVIGIWPRFIEPYRIETTQLNLKLPELPPALEGLKIACFSDLHLRPDIPDRYLEKLQKKISALNADLIVFTGDFLCFGQLNESERLKKFLQGFSAPYGCYAILGNHDYSRFISVNEEGDYDVLENQPSALSRGFKRLFGNLALTKKTTERAKKIKPHPDLCRLLEETPFKLLYNSALTIPVKDHALTLIGFGEYIIGDVHPEKVSPGETTLILLHNPDGIPLMTPFPNSIILCGHTHGGQVNLPWMWRKFILMENIRYKQGLHQLDNGSLAYISRGVGSVITFRWFAPPEIVLATLTKGTL